MILQSILLNRLSNNFIFSILSSGSFFLHPVYREQCCDDMVVNVKSPLIYAQALHHLATAQTWGPLFPWELPELKTNYTTDQKNYENIKKKKKKAAGK